MSTQLRGRARKKARKNIEWNTFSHEVLCTALSHKNKASTTVYKNVHLYDIKRLTPRENNGLFVFILKG